jgi:hypothetical protein
LNKCFVIQPFDQGPFDKRYDDVLVPAIRAASLDPYRVDRDPSVSIPIEDIQSGIQSSRVCLADITIDNPNVWFELGYAIASRREVVLICSEERATKFPFDVQHRSIIKYSTQSSSDFDILKNRITERLSSLLQKEGSLATIANMSPVASLHGLEQYEVATLIAVAQQLNGGVSANQIQDDMEKAGFTRLATMLGIRGLEGKKMLETYLESGWDDHYTSCRVTELGIDWLLQNKNNLKLLVELAEQPKDSVEPEVPF